VSTEIQTKASEAILGDRFNNCAAVHIVTFFLFSSSQSDPKAAVVNIATYLLKA
jgi:hypothetical protein